MLSFSLPLLLSISLIARVGICLYGIYQDNNFQVRFTDIDYFVFHDAAFYVFNNKSPFLRDTYRYTPLLSWLILPNHWFNCFHFSKFIFIVSDLLVGAIIYKFLNPDKNKILSTIWLLNPIVMIISTRGNAETLLCLFILSSLFFLNLDWYFVSAVLLGLSIHFKIYPIIYSLPIAVYIWKSTRSFKTLFCYGFVCLASLMSLNWIMYYMYGNDFLDNAIFYHFIRLDHRHNFSVWNTLLYFDSSFLSDSVLSTFAFFPQFLIVAILALLPLDNFKNLLNVCFLQTFAFVTFNKVCTSQYFIWYLIFLPFYIVDTTLSLRKGIVMIVVWIISQALWLNQGYNLEFLGLNVFYPGLFAASVAFFISNVWILGQCIEDIRQREIETITKKTI